MNNYEEVETLVKKVEIGKAIRERQANNEITEAYWNIGKLIVEAQGGKEKSKYGDKLLKEWSEKLTQEYGKGMIIQIYLDLDNYIYIFQLLAQWANN